MTHSVPTRRSSELAGAEAGTGVAARQPGADAAQPRRRRAGNGEDDHHARPLGRRGEQPAEGGRGAEEGAGEDRRQAEGRPDVGRSEEHTSEIQSLMRISYAVFCLKKKQYSN